VANNRTNYNVPVLRDGCTAATPSYAGAIARGSQLMLLRMWPKPAPSVRQGLATLDEVWLGKMHSPCIGVVLVKALVKVLASA
jgi:hypothetical protein